MIGTGGHGHTFPGVVLPHGMVQLSPDTRIDGTWDGCGGYHYSDSVIYGFSHTHLSGTGCSDYGDIMLMPMNGEGSFDKKIYSSHFSHKKEKAEAGFYSVHLDDENIDAALTATLRTGFHAYTFNKGGLSSIVLDLNHRDFLLDGEIKVVNDSTISVFRRSKAWAVDQRVYARIVFSKKFIRSRSLYENKLSDGVALLTNASIYSFNMKKGETLYVKVALSQVDDDGAKNNLEKELPSWNFNEVKQKASEAWDKELGKIEVSSKDKNQLVVFYTALYHTAVHPSLACDADGRYLGRDFKIHTAESFDYYTVFSLWDTFRAAHPLFTIIDEKRTRDYLKTFLAQYKEGGLLPVWELSSNETECMIGYHSVSAIADALQKGIDSEDAPELFTAMKASAQAGTRFGLQAYMEKGFLEMDDEHESVSKTMEYSYDDWCIAMVAKSLNEPYDYEYFMQRSEGWKNLFDKKTGFARPRKNGNWLCPFDPYEVNNNFTEANSWQYSFFVPHDVPAMIEMNGGIKKFEERLDQLFSASNKTSGREQVDITGLIGQYAHGNEPSHHMTYLYNYAGAPWKTSSAIKKILNEFYHNNADGLIGNEDCGQMSAWYVMSALGMYPVSPGNDLYDLTIPSFSKIILHTAYETPTVITTAESMNKTFISSMTINGNAISSPLHINHKDLVSGKNISLELSNDKSKFQPGSFTKEKNRIIPAPIIKYVSQSFSDSLMISIESNDEEKIFYSFSIANFDSFVPYTHAFYISESKHIKAYAEKDGMRSRNISAHLFIKPHPTWKIKINAEYNPQYTAGGDDGLMDGLRGDKNWSKGYWQGYQQHDFECIIDMGKVQNLTNFSAGFLQDTKSWILMPVNVAFSISDDGINFTEVGTVNNDVEAKNYEVTLKDFSFMTNQAIEARYVKVNAKNYGALPPWHLGYPYNGQAFIFIDEIQLQ